MFFRKPQSAIDVYILSGFISLAAIVFIFVAFFSMKKINKIFSFDQKPQTEEVYYDKQYYDDLASACTKKQDQNCCLSSVNSMRIGNYGLAEGEICSKGYARNTLRCMDSYSWCQPVEEKKFSLYFFYGDRILKSSFIVEADKNKIYFKALHNKTAYDKQEREITNIEADEILKTMADIDILNMQSQDFKRIPLLPDQGYYQVKASFDKKSNEIKCGIPLSNSQNSLACQGELNKLRVKLEEILGVKIE